MSRIAIFGNMTAQPGKIDELLSRFIGHAQASRAEPGCLRFDVAMDKQDANTFHFYEIWADQAALDVHAGTDRLKAHREATRGMHAARSVTLCDLRDSPDA